MKPNSDRKDKKSTSKRRAPGARRKAPKPPHNAREREFTCLTELIYLIANEPRPWNKQGDLVQVSRIERMYRQRVEKALTCDPKEVREILELMIKHPGLGRSHKTEWVLEIHGPSANA